MLNAFLVALAVFICVGGAELIGFTMLNRPIVIGPLVGLFLGDLHTGVIIGASLEAVFMGVVNIARYIFNFQTFFKLIHCDTVWFILIFLNDFFA